MASNILNAERIKEVLLYEPESGVFTRKMRTAQCHQIGDRADFPAHGKMTGYRTVSLAGTKWLAHRLAWVYVYGRWPYKSIDHINGDPGDNRISNLREATAKVNAQNKRSAFKSNKSGLLGAVWYEQSKKYRARIQVGCRIIHLGMFETAEDAHEAYVVAKRKHHEGCTI